MAMLDGLPLGPGPIAGEVRGASTAVACELLKPLGEDIRFDNVHNGWQVRGFKGGHYLVARHIENKSYDDAKLQGARALQEALDIASVEDNNTNNLAAVSDSSIVVHEEQGKMILSISSAIDFSVGMQFQVTATNREGQVIPTPRRPVPRWHKSFRYYRLAQISSDVYEAYRNLYLAFESLLETCHPRAQGEREGGWIRRGLAAIHAEFGLESFAPEGVRQPSEFLYGILYESTRCNLFHAQRANAILPYYNIDISRIRKAYDILLRLWRFLASTSLGAKSGGGVITYNGYRVWMDQVFGSSELGVCVTADDSPGLHEDAEVSPKGLGVSYLKRCRYGGESALGVVSAYIAEDDDLGRLPIINRIGLMLDRKLFAISFVRNLSLEGIGLLRVHVCQRLIQANQPRTIF